MDTNTIRERFFAFFGDRAHNSVPSSSLVANDPTLLLTNAGMNQFKPYFLGEQTPPYDRAMSVQKCFRTPDIDEVGKTARHLTFFEMLGNFSFGDYYKSEASRWAWELVTEGWGIDPERLWVTVYTTDDEAYQIWADEVQVRPERIVRRGKKDNFWSMGVAGPCGPCSEVYVDLGASFGPESAEGPAGNEDRYLEIWNLVFMQNDCNARIEPVGELPKKNIDTGAGVERVALVLQEAASVFETDVLGGLVEKAQELTGAVYGKDDRHDMALRVLADHGRGLTFLLADGVLPSNEKRGYVLRRIMRRAIWHARLLGRNEMVLAPMIERTVELMGGAYPELIERHDFVIEAAAREEERFDQTLKQGTAQLQEEISKNAQGNKKLPGEVAFKLHDTFGFPVDLTREIAEAEGLDVDIETFETLMDQQRVRARAARKEATETDLPEPSVLSDLTRTTEFIGYEQLASDGDVVAITSGNDRLEAVEEGEQAYVILDRTPFYAEGGGQLGDRGLLRGSSGEAEVLDTQRVGGFFAHRIKVTSGELVMGEQLNGVVDAEFRTGCEQAHTATHILHWALRDRLGDHARQAGSLVEPGRLRFDFNHFEALDADQVADIASEVQSRVSVDDRTRAYETSMDYARSIGAMAMFGEKYGDFVRVVEVGEYSKELCGGTHVPNTSRIGVSVILGEGSVGANLRRVEALVGRHGIEYLEHRAAELTRAAELLRVAPDEVGERIERLLALQKDMEKRLEAVEKSALDSDADTLASQAVDVDGARMIAARRDLDVDGLRSLAQNLKGRLGSSIVVLGAAGDGRANLVAAVSKDLVSKGISARELLAAGATLLGGGAGGKPELAVSGGRDSSRIDEAIEAVAAAARSALTAG